MKTSDTNEVLSPHLEGVVQQALIATSKGAAVHFQWTCLHCGARQTFEKPNVLHKRGQCEKCNGVSDLNSPTARVGLMFPKGTPVDAVLAALGGE